MTSGHLLLIAAWASPLALLVACINTSLRASWRILLPMAPVPALATALLVPIETTLTLPNASYGLTFTLDKPGAILLAGASLLWIAAAVFAAAYRRNGGDDRRFAVWWLATLTGSLGIFITADLYGFYLFFTIVSLSAYWLIVGNDTPLGASCGRRLCRFRPSG